MMVSDHVLLPSFICRRCICDSLNTIATRAERERKSEEEK